MGKIAGQKIQSGACDHLIKYLIRFKKGGMTDVAIPESLLIYIQEKSIVQSAEGE